MLVGLARWTANKSRKYRHFTVAELEGALGPGGVGVVVDEGLGVQLHPAALPPPAPLLSGQEARSEQSRKTADSVERRSRSCRSGLRKNVRLTMSIQPCCEGFLEAPPPPMGGPHCRSFSIHCSIWSWPLARAGSEGRPSCCLVPARQPCHREQRQPSENKAVGSCHR